MDPKAKLSYTPALTWSLHSAQGMLVSIDTNTGKIIFGEHYTPDEAARVFWEGIGGTSAVTAGMIAAGLARAYELVDDWPAPEPVAKNFISEVLKAAIERRLPNAV